MSRRVLRAVLVACLASACQGASPSASPPSAASAPPAAATASVAPTAAPTAAPPASSVSELVRTAEALAAARYTRAAFLPRITFEVEAGTWRAVNLLTGFFDIQDAPSTPDVVAVQFARPSGIYGAGTSAEAPADAAAAVAILRTNPRLVVVESSESRMDGLVGSQVTIENPTSGSGTASVMEVPPGALGIDPGRRLWIAFFDTPDGLLASMVGGSVAGWDAALLLAEPVLESVTIGA